jgi:Ca2+-binding EF-hand superfamily protein
MCSLSFVSMGAGKTTVVGPLLSLMLADGISLVTMVVPSALLPMSRAVLRARFSSIVPKRIHTLSYDRLTKDDPKLIAKLLYKLNQAKKKQGIIIATAISVKSLMLKFLELIVSLQSSPPTAQLTPGEAQLLSTKSLVIDGLGEIISLWRSGILILDEIDLLLHPLKSELNFPCGPKVPLEPTPNRWNFPMHLIDAFFYKQTGYLSLNAFHELPEAQCILNEINEILESGIHRHTVQIAPHLVILNNEYYHKELKPILARWSLLWLKAKGMSIEIPDEILLEYMIKGWNNPNVSTAVTNLLSKPQMVLLNLSHQWLNSFLIHILGKINRVGYGLLREDEIEESAVSGQANSQTRRLVAIPFIAKDVPSRSSEFANAETVIGLTILAYRIEGIRRNDLKNIISTLKNSLTQEMGPEHMRPSAKLFDSFIKQAKLLHLRQINLRDKDNIEVNTGGKKKKNITALETRRKEDERILSLRILPLSQFSLTDPSQLHSLFLLIRRLPSLLDYYLNSYLFPTCMHHQLFNLSASGQELGNGMLFSTSLGFSGTPSDLLPLELGKCIYERGSDGKVLAVLTSNKVVSYSIKPKWSVLSLLRDIALHRSPIFHCLIDTGALITGLENREVAAYLLENGLNDMDGCVYLDSNDQQMVLLRSNPTVPLPRSQCGIAPSKLFTFFDQIHTTGIDTLQATNAVAVVTLGKDMTFRDYAQGAFRMRQIGKGQKIHLFIIPEIVKLIERELNLENKKTSTQLIGQQDGDLDVSTSDSVAPSSALFQSLPTHVAAWLTINSMRMEQLQFYQLCLQNLHSVWRKKAFTDLLNDAITPSPPALQSRRAFRFDLNASNMHPNILWLIECISLFKLGISFAIEDTIPVSKPFFATLKTLLSQHTPFILTDEQCLSVASVLNQSLEASQTLLPRNTLDKEMVNEQEREQEQEKHQEILRDPRAARNEETHQTWNINLLKSTQPLHPVGGDGRMVPNQFARHTSAGGTITHPFYSLSSFALEGRPLPLSFHRSLLMSHNYFRQSWALYQREHRRLKNIYILLEWCPPRTSISSVNGSTGSAVAAAAVGAVSSAPIVPQWLPPIVSTPIQSDRWYRAFQLLDVDRDGQLRSGTSEFDILRRIISTQFDEDIPISFFRGIHSISPKELQQLMQALTKRQEAGKVAGFIPISEDEEEEEKKSEDSSIRFVSPSALDLLSCTQNEESERYFVIIPLSEAQTLRRAVHTANPLFRRKAQQQGGMEDVQFALWSLDGHLIETTPFYTPASRPMSNTQRDSKKRPQLNNYQITQSLQTARFMNGELYYSEPELVSLLRGLVGVHPWHRRQLMDQLLLARHRDHRTIAKTPVEQAILFDDEAHWMILHSLRVALRAACDAKGLSLLQAFHLCDVEGKGLLGVDELWTVCHALGLTGNGINSIHPSDIVDFIRYADTNGDGKLDFSEFTVVLCTREEAAAAVFGHQGTTQIDEQPKSQSSSSSSSTEPSLTKLTLMKMPTPEKAPPTPSFIPPVPAASATPTAPVPQSTPVRPSIPAANPSMGWGFPAFPQQPPAAVPVQPAQQPQQSQARFPAAIAAATTEWNCPVCTYRNGPGRSRCEMCDTPKQ